VINYNNNIINGELRNIFISEVCFKLVAQLLVSKRLLTAGPGFLVSVLPEEKNFLTQ